MESRNYKKELAQAVKLQERAFLDYEGALSNLPKGVMSSTVADLGYRVYEIQNKIEFLQNKVLSERFEKINQQHN